MAALAHVFRAWITRRNNRRDTAAGTEVALDLSPYGIGRLHHVIEHLVDDVLLKDAEISVAEEILFERLELEALLARHVTDKQRAEIRQPGLGADACELRVVDQDLVFGELIAPRLDRRKVCVEA